MRDVGKTYQIVRNESFEGFERARTIVKIPSLATILSEAMYPYDVNRQHQAVMTSNHT